MEDIGKMIEGFNSCAADSRDKLNHIIEMIDGGRRPDADSRKALDDSLDELNDKYADIMNYAAEIVREDELPEDGSPVQSFIDAISNSESAASERIGEAIRKFISIRSDVARLSETLKPFQDDAADLLTDKDSYSFEEYSDKARGPQLFIRAMDSDDIWSEEGQQTIDALGRDCGYPPFVISGLTAGQYHFTEAADEQTEAVEEKAEQAETVEEQTVQPEPETEQKTEDAQQEENTEPVTEEEEATEDSDFVKALKEADIAMPAEKYGEFNCDISPDETKKITPSKFKSELRHGDEGLLRSIIHTFAEHPVISEAVIMILSDDRQNTSVTTAIEYLYRKGYLRKYKITPGGGFYTASPRLWSVLSHTDACSFVKTKCVKRDISEVTFDKASEVMSRAAQIAIIQWPFTYYVKFMNKKQVDTCGGDFIRDGFCIGINDKNPNDGCDIIIGQFWSGYGECDSIKETLDSFIKAVRTNHLIFAARNQETAKKTADITLANCDINHEDDHTYLYSVETGKYYAYTDGKETEPYDIWKKPEQEAVDEESNEPEKVEAEEAEPEEQDQPVAEDTETTEEDRPEAVETKEKEKPEAEEVKAVEDEKSESKPETGSEKKPEQKPLGVHEAVYQMLNAGRAYCAMAYARVAAEKNSDYSNLCSRLAYALNDPMEHCIYSSETGFGMVPDKNDYFSECMMVSIGLRTFFSNQVEYDHGTQGFYNAIKNYRLLNDYSAIGNVMYILEEFKEKQNKGIDTFADYREKDKADQEEKLNAVIQEAKTFYESTILAKKSEKAANKRFIETKKNLFAKDSDIGMYMKCVADNDTDSEDIVEAFVRDNFIDDGNNLREDNINSDRVFDYINTFWDAAGENMANNTRMKLMSSLRNNIVKLTDKAISILVNWCNLIRNLDDSSESDSNLEYKKIRQSLIDSCTEAVDSVSKDLAADVLSDDEKAGLEIIKYTVNEILHCVDGSYNEVERKYFYFGFLLTEDVLLGDDYCPDLDTRDADIPELQPETRILSHAGRTLPSPEERLTEIFDQKGDDYGTARQIIDYMRAMDLDSDSIDRYEKDLNEGEEYAAQDAKYKKQKFIGDLELAQSYGQIINSDSNVNKKDKILQIVDEWYEYCCESENYGFFRYVADCYMTEISNEAKSRETDLLEQLQNFRNRKVSGITAEMKEDKIKRIRGAIEKQNYTVAEDILARADQPDGAEESAPLDDFLNDFLENYEEYYTPVAHANNNFAALVGKRVQNKEGRGGKKLSDNWLPGGSRMSVERLSILLSALGFAVESSNVKPMGSIGIGTRHESFEVRTLAEKDGRCLPLNHPIAAFGSGAAQNGFRVVCLNGKYDANGLIDVMKQIGDAKNTMILLDCALTLAERRRLARKTKNDLGGKLFIVLDRTVMMYLVKNYDENKVNRMLMALVVPFGYYQPYVWESSNVMPPEIFMGRRKELGSIESPIGANIVYGGRQLGKSALLKKAKSDIDHDENGDRAVFVDIKGCDYKEAAKKVGYALCDEGILEEDIDTDDWDELSRLIRKRLKSDKNRIPYFLLLMDEADAFIESCGAINYRPLDALKETQQIGTDRFKFVIAGLRNVVRFKREALNNNSVLTHLEPITIKPFEPKEARELIEVPLHYLGFEFPRKKEYLITLILATTNYFPGLIQLYCAKLIEAMKDSGYAGYDEADTPIYEISEDHIRAVLSDKEFMNQINEKFFITLRLDEDNYYYIIALLMAYLYHTKKYTDGYSAADIREIGCDFEIRKIMDLDVEKIGALMEELRELNILKSTDDGHYLFARYSFYQMMGTAEEVDSEIEKIMEEQA